MPRYYTPAVRFGNQSNSGSAAFKSMSQTAEKIQQVPSDHASQPTHFGGVLRKARDWRGDTIRFKFKPVPAICDPSVVEPASQAIIAVTGANFTSGCRIFLDELEVSQGDITFVDENHLTFKALDISPIEEDLYVVLTVLRPDGMSGSNDDIFRYERNPKIVSVSSSAGYIVGEDILATPTISSTVGFINGGEFITVIGSYFKNHSTAKLVSPTFETYETGLTWFSSEHVDLITPEVETTGAYRLRIYSPSGLFSTDEFFHVYEYHPPVFDSVTPNYIATDESKLVLAEGDYFIFTGVSSTFVAETSGSTSPLPSFVSGAWSVSGTSWALRPTISSSAQQMQFLASGSNVEGTRSLIVLHPDGKKSSLQSIYYVRGLPVITQIEPRQFGSGTVIAVTGNHLSSSDDPLLVVKTASFVSGALSYSSPFSFGGVTSMYVTSTNMSEGVYELRLTSDVGTGTSAPSIYVTFSAPPIINSITPSTGGEAGGFVVRVLGSNLIDGATIFTVDGITANASFTGTTLANIIMPSHSAGYVGITATNYTTLSASRSFRYVVADSLMSGTQFFPEF